jgi:hypothetical protein
MYYGIVILILIVIVTFVMVAVFILRKNQALTSITDQRNDVIENSTGLQTQVQSLQTENKYLKRVKDVDELIFQFIRCINVPKSPTCKTTYDDNPNSTIIPSNKANVCRSRQIDCNKYKLLIVRDQVGIDRLKIATDRFTQTDQEKNPSNLTYPVVSGWFF